MVKSIYRREYAILVSMLRDIRAQSGKSQLHCAEELGRPQSFISDVENGVRRLDLVQIRDFCQVVGKNFLDFITEFENAVRGTEEIGAK